MPKFIASLESYDEDIGLDTQDVLTYKTEINGYAIAARTKIIGVLVCTADEMHEFYAGNITKLYPQFDPKKHEIYQYHGDRYSKSSHEVGLLTIRELTDVVKEVPHGAYKAALHDRYGLILKPLNMIDSDRYIEIRQDGLKLIAEDLKKFRDSKAVYEEEGVRHRRGVLLYGPPGNGKTREIARILESSKDDKLVSIFVPSEFAYLSQFDRLKPVLKNQDVVFIMEEITERSTNRSLEDLLSFLDGEMSWNNSYIIGTTNHPEDIPKNIIDRPGRFEMVIEFGNPTFGERLRYLQGRKYTHSEAEEISHMTDGMSLDYIAQIVTQARVNNVTIKEYIKSSKEKKDKISQAFKGKMGL